MPFTALSFEICFHPARRRKQKLSASFFVLLFAALSGLAQSSAKKPVETSHKKEPEVKKPEIKEELILKNGDKLTGQLLNSSGTDIKFKTDLAGEVTVPWGNIKELKSSRKFAVVPKDIKDARNSDVVPQGQIKLTEKGIVISPVTATSPESATALAASETKPVGTQVLVDKLVPASKIEFIVDDSSYQKEIHKRIGWTSGWDGHITTGTTAILSTQNSYLFEVSTALKRTVPTVSWLNPKLRTIVNFSLSAGKTTQPGTPETVTNIYHADSERDEYFSRRGYYLQAVSFDHNFAQGLILQQNYGGGIGATLFKKLNSEFDITTDLHYESQQFNATADVSQLTLHLIGSGLTEAYTRKWKKINFDEKLLADVAFNNANAFSASGTSSVRTPVFKSLAYSISIIDNYLNNPQIGYKKNSFQLSTGFALSLH